jgi:hypothetical protein
MSLDLFRAIRENPLRDGDDARRLLLDLNTPPAVRPQPRESAGRLGLECAHFDREAKWFEGYARPLWGLVPLAAGGGSFDN